MMPRRRRRTREEEETKRKMKQNTNDNHLEINSNVVAALGCFFFCILPTLCELKMSEKMGNELLQFLYKLSLGWAGLSWTGNIYVCVCFCFRSLRENVRRLTLFHFHSLYWNTQLHQCVRANIYTYKTNKFSVYLCVSQLFLPLSLSRAQLDFAMPRFIHSHCRRPHLYFVSGLLLLSR